MPFPPANRIAVTGVLEAHCCKDPRSYRRSTSSVLEIQEVRSKATGSPELLAIVDESPPPLRSKKPDPKLLEVSSGPSVLRIRFVQEEAIGDLGGFCKVGDQEPGDPPRLPPPSPSCCCRGECDLWNGFPGLRKQSRNQFRTQKSRVQEDNRSFSTAPCSSSSSALDLSRPFPTSQPQSRPVLHQARSLSLTVGAPHQDQVVPNLIRPLLLEE